MHLGYYIHLHGKGHAQRAREIARNLNIPLTFIGTDVSQHDWTDVKDYRLLDLPPDKLEYVLDLPINRDCQTYSYHYAPYYSSAYRSRAVAIANWVEKIEPTAVVVDVSAEITQYLRLLGVPVLGMRQHGDRTDLPHLCGYDAAYKLIAPYPEMWESPNTPDWIKDKTIYTSGFSRYSQRQENKSTARQRLNISSRQKVVLVINGRGGDKHSLSKIVAAASATPEWLWLVVGQTDSNPSIPDNVSLEGWCEDTYIYLKAADVAIASGGHNTVMEIATAKVPFLCIPESRPFNEQHVKAKILEQFGLCKMDTEFPTSNYVKSLLHELTALDANKWNRFMTIDGATRAAEAIAAEVKLLASYQNYTFYKTV